MKYLVLILILLNSCDFHLDARPVIPSNKDMTTMQMSCDIDLVLYAEEQTIMAQINKTSAQCQTATTYSVISCVEGKKRNNRV